MKIAIPAYSISVHFVHRSFQEEKVLRYPSQSHLGREGALILHSL